VGRGLPCILIICRELKTVNCLFSRNSEPSSPPALKRKEEDGFTFVMKQSNKNSRPKASTLTCSTREQLSLLYYKVSISMYGPEKPGDIPKTRKLAALKQYGFLNGIPPGFSPADRFFRQRPRGYGNYEDCRRHQTPPWRHNFCKASSWWHILWFS